MEALIIFIETQLIYNVVLVSDVQQIDCFVCVCVCVFVCVASLVAQLVKNPPEMQEPLLQFLGQEDPLEKG